MHAVLIITHLYVLGAEWPQPKFCQMRDFTYRNLSKETVANIFKIISPTCIILLYSTGYERVRASSSFHLNLERKGVLSKGHVLLQVPVSLGDVIFDGVTQIWRIPNSCWGEAPFATPLQIVNAKRSSIPKNSQQK